METVNSTETISHKFECPKVTEEVAFTEWEEAMTPNCHNKIYIIYIA